MSQKGQINLMKKILLQWIKNFPWMVATMEEAQKPVAKVDDNSFSGAKTAMYGFNVTLPKADGGISDPVFNEVQHRVYLLNYRTKEYEQKIAEVQARIPLVYRDRGRLKFFIDY